MKLRIISDIHEEIWSCNRSWPRNTIPELEDDKDTTLILAGDIASGVDAASYAESYARRFKHVIFVLGNHEYYGNNLDTLSTEIRDHLKILGHENVYFLNDDTVVIDGVRFVGGTLWTNYNEGCPLAMFDARSFMYDFRAISQNSGKRITPDQFIYLHQRTRDYIKHVTSTPFDGKTVVITHHAPHPRSVNRKYLEAGNANYAFYSDCSEMFEKDIVLWVHGHMHDYVQYEELGTTVICNPYGYPNENKVVYDELTHTI